MRRLLTAAATLLVIGVLALMLLSSRIDSYMDAPVNIPPGGVAFDIPAGSSFSSVAKDLLTQEIIDDDLWLRVYVRWKRIGGAIKAGEYGLEAGDTPRTLMNRFIEGTVKLHTFTLVEGWNRYEVLAALHSHDALRATISDADWPELLTSLGATTSNPEGLFLPETYHFARNTSDRELLGQAYQLMQDVLADEWSKKSADTPAETPYEALILASIVEKETARADERGKIAGVLARRLSTGMRLQMDPTVIYGIGPSFNGNLTRVDLRTDTAYNTYTRHGLPPTPIAMPGQAAIQAALNPADGNELYFVATGLPDGSHKFSATKEEHDDAVASYLAQLRRNRQQDRSR